MTETGTREGDVLAPFLTQGLEGFNVDDEEDWERAERLVARGEAALTGDSAHSVFCPHYEFAAALVSDQQEPDVDEIWQGFARARPEYFILTEEVPFDGPVDMDAFFASGRRDAATILEEVSAELQRASLCDRHRMRCGKAGDSDVWSLRTGDWSRHFAHDARGASSTTAARNKSKTSSRCMPKTHGNSARAISCSAGSSSSIWKRTHRSSDMWGVFVGRSQQEALPIFSSTHARGRSSTGCVTRPRTSSFPERLEEGFGEYGVQPTRFGGSSTPPASAWSESSRLGTDDHAFVLRRSDAISVNE